MKMNRNAKYGVVGIALIGAIPIAFNSWEKYIQRELESIKREKVVEEYATAREWHELEYSDPIKEDW